LLLLLGCALDRSRVASRAASAATAAPAAGGLLQLAHRALCLLLLRLVGARWSLLLLLLLLRLWAWSTAALRLLLLWALTLTAPLRALALRSFAGPVAAWRLRTLAVALTLGTRSTVVLAARFAGALLVLADFFLHEPPRLLIQFQADLVMAAVRTTLPSFGIGFLATGAEDGFRERHR
jgi:hypothetical protein